MYILIGLTIFLGGVIFCFSVLYMIGEKKYKDDIIKREDILNDIRKNFELPAREKLKEMKMEMSKKYMQETLENKLEYENKIKKIDEETLEQLKKI